MKRLSKLLIALTLLASINHSKESCEMLKKTVTLYYKIERVLYLYVKCTNLIPSNFTYAVSSTVNSSSPYLDVSDSDLPELTSEMFWYLNLTQLTIAGNVQVIQEKSFERCNITTITLSGNKIRRVKDNAFKSFSIYYVDLGHNLLDEIEARSFAGAQNLRKLNLENNRISSIQTGAFNDLSGLEELNLSSNRLNSINSKTFWPLYKILLVNLSNNLLKEIETNTFDKNTELENLNIKSNNLSYLDVSKFPKSLKILSLEQNNLNFINASNLTKLQKLVLDSNRLKNVKNSLNNLPALNSLHLNSNLMGPIITDDAFPALTNLSILELDNNRITSLKSLKKITALEGISLAENSLKFVDFSNFPSNIQLINLTFNSITNISNVSSLSNLTKLELSHNQLKEIDYNMFQDLFYLHSLWLHHNQINKLSLGCFRSLKSLERLDLSFNRITSITTGTLNGLDTVSELYLNYNDLTYLSEDIFHNMKDLRTLGIAYNNLSNVNVRGILTHTIWLKEIDLKGNNWTCKLLSNISRDNRLLTIKTGLYYNVSNIYGIPCTETRDVKEKIDRMSDDEYSSSLNNIANFTYDISVKLSVILTLLILYFVFAVGKDVLSRYTTRTNATQQFVYQKTQSEAEIHLI